MPEETQSWPITLSSSATGTSTDRLTILPREILDSIVECIYTDTQERTSTLLSASVVSRALREVCLPILFRSIVVSFSSDSLGKLSELSVSPFAPLVRTIEYKGPLLLIPGSYAPHAKFSRCVFYFVGRNILIYSVSYLTLHPSRLRGKANYRQISAPMGIQTRQPRYWSHMDGDRVARIV